MYKAVVNTFIVAITVSSEQISIQLGNLQRFSNFLGHIPAHGRRIDNLESRNLNRIDRHVRRSFCHCLLPALTPFCIGSRIDGQALQSRRCTGSGESTVCGFIATVKISGSQSIEIRLDVDIVGGECFHRLGDILRGQDGNHLGRDREQAADFAGFEQGRAYIDSNDDLGCAAITYFLYGKVVHQSTVHKFASTVFQRRHQAGHRHTGTHGHGQAAISKNHPLATTDIRGDYGNRQGHLLNLTFTQIGTDQLVEKKLDLLTGDNAWRGCDTTGRDAGLTARQITLQ